MTRPLFDRSALMRQRHRAQAGFASFLHEHAVDEIKDRLSLVNKSFTDTTIVSATPVIWKQAFPEAAHVAEEETLALAEASQDLIIHALGLHWSNDPLGQLIQCRRALRPDGLLMAALFGGTTLHQLRASFAQAEADLYGGLSPRIAPMAEIRDLGALLQRAGLALPVADSVPLTVSYETPLHLMRDLRAMGETNAMTDRARTPMPRALLQRACEVYRDSFADTDGRVLATFDMVFLIGWAPAPDQPQPLRPGSAKARLADALGAKETPLKD
ncbi:MAG: methyltransferase domain-containing protein [Roseovarius sp.]